MSANTNTNNNDATASAPLAPPHFCCPITLALMENPVLAPDGNSYELSALEQWAATKIAAGQTPTLPTTNVPFTVDQLTPNRGLKDAIDQWRVLNGLAPAPPVPQPAVVAAAAQSPAPRGPIALNIAPTRYFKSRDGSAYVAVPPTTGPERHLHVVVVMDVSGSMSTVASMKDETGEEAEMTNTVLDIVKYAAKAVAHMLGPNDSFSLVKFSSTASTILTHKPTRNEADVQVIDTAIERIRTEGATNLGDGLRCALQTVVDNHQSDPNRLNVVIMLTDGQPNEGPVAVDVLGAFRRSKKEVPANPQTNAPATTQGDIIMNHTIINTYAFGYGRHHNGDDLSSSLMYDVATLGNGTYGYIPDIGFLGTQFIHCLANMRAVASVASKVIGADVAQSSGLWTVQYNQIGFSCNNVDSLKNVDFSTPVNEGSGPGLTEEEIARVKVMIPRASAGFVAADALLTCLRGPKETRLGGCKYDKNGIRIDDGVKSIKTITEDEAKETFALLDTSALDGLADDISSQIVIAFRPNYFARWGKHYLYGWLSAHQHQVCINFKDKSLATHKTSFVQAIHDTYNDIFNMMPPPKPTVAAEDDYGYGFGRVRGGARMAGGALAMAAAPMSTGRSRRVIQSSTMINSSYNPCVHEDTRVQLADGSWRAAKDLVPGDAVRSVAKEATTTSADAPVVLIDHIIRTQCLDGKAQLVCFPPMKGQTHGLRVTAWHPVLVKDTPAQSKRQDYVVGTYEWMMPADTGYAVEEHQCNHVYSFTVKHVDGSIDGDHQSNAPAIVAEGVSTVYLAHNRKADGGAILSHDFFGTSAVLEQLLEAHPTHRRHEFKYAPVTKAEDPHGKGLLGSGWDLSKYVGEW